jgi:hypothetical protein
MRTAGDMKRVFWKTFYYEEKQRPVYQRHSPFAGNPFCNHNGSGAGAQAFGTAYQKDYRERPDDGAVSLRGIL